MIKKRSKNQEKSDFRENDQKVVDFIKESFMFGKRAKTQQSSKNYIFLKTSKKRSILLRNP